MDNELLIRALVADADPVVPLAPPWRRTFVWFAGICLLGIFLSIVGNASGALARLTGAGDAMVAEAGAILTALSAGLAAMASAVPGRSRFWPLVPLPPLALWIGASGLGCLRHWILPGMHVADMAETMDCLMFILGVSVPLSAALIFLLRRAAPLRPNLTAALAGLASAAAAASLLGFFHRYDASLVDLGVHLAAVAVVVLLNRAFGGRMLQSAA